MQYRLINITPSADGKTVTAVVNDRDWGRDSEAALPDDIRVVGEDEEGRPILRFPKHHLVHGNVLDTGDRVERLYGAAEFAEALDWTSQRFANARKRGHVPPPAQEVRATPLWTHSQVEEFVATQTARKAVGRNREVVVIREVYSPDPEAKPFVVSYRERDGLLARRTESFETLEEARASVPERFVLGKPPEDADGDVLLVGRVKA